MAISNCFYIENKGTSQVQITSKIKCEFSSDLNTWYSLNEGGSVTMEPGWKLYFKGTGYEDDSPGLDWFGLGELEETDSVAIGGSLQSLLWDGDGDNQYAKINASGRYCIFSAAFGSVKAHLDVSNLILNANLHDEDGHPVSEYYRNLFVASPGLTSIPSGFKLQATSLTPSCYIYMFCNCRNLEEVPADLLPATIGANNAYHSMFENCEKLRRAPDINLTELTPNDLCMEVMFSGCTSLNEIHVSFKDWQSYGSTYLWVQNVASEGDFYCPEELPEIMDESAIPVGWTVHKSEPPVPPPPSTHPPYGSATINRNMKLLLRV